MDFPLPYDDKTDFSETDQDKQVSETENNEVPVYKRERTTIVLPPSFVFDGKIYDDYQPEEVKSFDEKMLKKKVYQRKKLKEKAKPKIKSKEVKHQDFKPKRKA